MELECCAQLAYDQYRHAEKRKISSTQPILDVVLHGIGIRLYDSWPGIIPPDTEYVGTAVAGLVQKFVFLQGWWMIGEDVPQGKGKVHWMSVSKYLVMGK